MTSTLIPTCPLCGLRYTSKPLLELHIREDHRSRRRAKPGRTDADGSQAPAPAAIRPPRRPRPKQVITVPRRVLRTLRHVNDELTRASEAIIRSARIAVPPADPGIHGQGHSPG